MVRRLLVWVISGLVAAWIAIGCLAVPGTAFAATDSDGDSGSALGSSQSADPARSTTEPSGTTPTGPKAATDPGTHDADTSDTVDAGGADVPETDKSDADTDAPEPGDADPDTPPDAGTGASTSATSDPETLTNTVAVETSAPAAAPDQRAQAAPTEPATPTKTVEPETAVQETLGTSANEKTEPVEVQAGAVTPATVQVDEPESTEKAAKVVDTAKAVETTATTIAVAAADVAPKAAATSGPTLLNVVGTLFFAVFDFISQILEGPPAVPARLEGLVTVGRSKLEIDCGDGYSAYTDWYFPTSEVPPTGIIYFQHGWPGRAGFYNETAAELAVRTNSIVLAPSITGNFFACDACHLTSDQMHYAVAKLFTGDWSALTASASAAAGHDVVLPRRYILAGHSGGAMLAGGVAGYAAQIADLTGQPLLLAGVLLLDGSGANGTIGRGLAKLPADVPVLSLSAEPSVLNGFADLDAVLDTYRPDVFTGLRLIGATHGDFSQSSNPLVQAGMNLFGGQPTPVNTEAVLEISRGWIADMFAGTVYDEAARTGVYGQHDTIVQIPTVKGTASAHVLPGPTYVMSLGDYISQFLFASLGLLAYSPCAADVDALLQAEFGGTAPDTASSGTCRV